MSQPVLGAPAAQPGSTGAPRSANERRRAVAHLDAHTPGLSHRAVGALLGIGKDTVRRDREWLTANPAPPGPAQGTSPAAQPTAPPTPDPTAPGGAAMAHPAAPPPAHYAAALSTPVAPPGAVSHPATPPGAARPTAAQYDAPLPAPPGAGPATPRAGGMLPVALDSDGVRHLALLAEAGHNPQDAVALGLALLADAYERAWRRGYYPRGTPPRIRAFRYHDDHEQPTTGDPALRP